jgi:class 3 adenylate cyclase/predicted ATPase
VKRKLPLSGLNQSFEAAAPGEQAMAPYPHSGRQEAANHGLKPCFLANPAFPFLDTAASPKRYFATSVTEPGDTAVDVARWLRNLGLERYETAFRENEVGAGDLCHLTAEDLEGLGVAAIGHRRRLLVAIAKLREDVASPQTARPTDDHPASTSAGERRQLTVMFCDLVGSTALSEKLDPEELRSLLHVYRTLCGDVIARYDGFVARYVGDGIMTYFGWPIAHEEDAERAVRAALEIVHNVKRASSTEDLSVRIGIATGPVVVGEAAGAGDQSKLAVGSTPNLAARLQGLAAVDQIVFAASTRRLVGSAFELIDLGEHELKGMAEPVHAWRVERALATESRFDANRGGALTPLVGRNEELDLLLRRWSQARDGEGQVVLLSGEPGIGKSRILGALRERLEAQDVQALRFQCSPYYVNSAFWPIIDNFERALKFTRDDTADTKLDELEALVVAHYGQPLADVRFVASILSIPWEKRYGALPMTPQKHKDETLRTLVDITEAAARLQTSMLLFEDAHWADPSTLEVLDLLIDRVRTVPLLVVLTHRPEFQSRWSGQGHVGALNLSKLTRAQSAAIVSALAGGKALPEALLEQILTRTDGVPLFVEELTKSILESGELKEAGDHYKYGDSARAVTIPTTLRDSLMARLDRFMPVKEIAQIGAAIGREFSYELIAAVAPMPQAQLDDSLAQLTESGLAFRRGTPPDATYTFKHALVQDAAHRTLLRRDRQRLHKSIAEAVEEHFAQRTAREPELLAHHFAEAGQTERAIEYWLKAGERDIGRSANLEALRQLTRGLDALRTLPESAERDRCELAFQIAIGGPLIAVHGYSAPQAGAAYQQARALCERLGEVEPLVATLSGEFVYYFVRGDYPMMCRLTHEAQQVSRRVASPILQLAAHRLAGITAMHYGDFPRARSEFQSILRMYDASQHRSKPGYYVHDPEVSALTYLAPILWLLGFPDQARLSSSAAFRCAAELDQANLTAHVHNFAGAGLAELEGDVSAVRAHADAMIELADRHSLGYWRVNGLILRGWAMVQDGATESGIGLMVSNVLDRAALNVAWYQARYLCMLAETYARSNQAIPGLTMIREAKALAARNDEHMWKAELDRVEGELLEAEGAPAVDIEACFARAIQKAREQSAKSLELRAAVSLARLWSEQGRSAEARDLLAPVYGWFTEGFDTRDLLDAKALLDELA